MADPLSAAASIIAVIQISQAVLAACYNYANAVKDAPQDIGWIINEVGSLKVILEELKSLENAITSSQSSALFKSLKADHGPLATCHSALAVIARTLGDSAKGPVSRKSSFIWPFKQKSVQALLEIIQKQKSNLILALAADESRATTRIEASIEENSKLTTQMLESLILNTDATQEVRHAIEDASRSLLHEKILQWLRTADPSTNHNDAWEKHEPTTGTWLLKSPEFVQWRDGKGEFLWLNGLSGCGKTTLSAILIEHIKSHCAKRTEARYAYFYFDFNDPEKRKSTAMLRSILAQLSDSPWPLPKEVENLYELCNSGSRQPALSELIRSLSAILTAQEPIHLIIDALDECDDRGPLLSTMTQLRSQASQEIHILVTSRREYDVTTTMADPSICDFEIQNHVVDSDIKMYIKSLLSADLKLKRWPEDVKNEIEEALMEKSNGMFRWVVCQLEACRGCRNLRILRTTLKELPRTLYETYDRILQRIPESHRESAQAALTWIAFSLEPLTLDEVAEASVIDVAGGTFSDEDRLFDVHDILEACSSLVSLESDAYRPVRHPYRQLEFYYGKVTLIKLAHASVQEYLESQEIKKSFCGPSVAKPVTRASMVDVCLIHLISLDSSKNLTPSQSEGVLEHSDSLFDSYPFMRYAALFWYRHYPIADVSTTTKARVLELLDVANECWHCWSRIVINCAFEFIDFRDSRPIDRPLHLEPPFFATRLQIPGVLEILIQNRSFSFLSASLTAAVLMGNRGREMVHILLKGGAAVGDKYGGKTPLLHALAKRDTGMVGILLDWEPDITTHSTNVSSVLSASIVNADFATLKLLFQRGLRFDSAARLQEEFIGAINCEDVRIVQLLIDHGADINAEDEDHDFPLAQASMDKWSHHTLRMLLSCGADMNHIAVRDNGDKYGALQMAAGWHNLAGIRILLSCGTSIPDFWTDDESMWGLPDEDRGYDLDSAGPAVSFWRMHHALLGWNNPMVLKEIDNQELAGRVRGTEYDADKFWKTLSYKDYRVLLDNMVFERLQQHLLQTDLFDVN